VTIDGVEKPVTRVLVVPPDLTPGPGLRYQFQVRLTLAGFIPNDAEAVVTYTPVAATAPKEVAKGRTLAAPGKHTGNAIGDADIYLGFTYTASRATAETRHVGGIRAHVERPFYFWGRARRDVFAVVPRFDALVHAKELDDEDSMSLKADVEWQRMLGNLDRLPDPDRAPEADANPIYNIRTSFGGGLEFSKGFREHNAIAEGQFAPAFHVFGTTYPKPHALEGIRLMVAPAAGFELGRVIDSQAAGLVNSSVRRLKGGVDAQLRFMFRDAPYADAFVIEASYIGRKLFTKEQYVDDASSGADKQSRHYGRFAAKVAFNANFEAFLSYSRGSLPPKFERVNKVEAGLAFRYNAGY
jgi:hypothetical protein